VQALAAARPGVTTWLRQHGAAAASTTRRNSAARAELVRAVALGHDRTPLELAAVLEAQEMPLARATRQLPAAGGCCAAAGDERRDAGACSAEACGQPLSRFRRAEASGAVRSREPATGSAASPTGWSLAPDLAGPEADRRDLSKRFTLEGRLADSPARAGR
jgi:hypothetical protein